jgi:hypothetical protein
MMIDYAEEKSDPKQTFPRAAPQQFLQDTDYVTVLNCDACDPGR